MITNNYNDPTAMMLEYLPDYIVYTENKVFFLEIKVSTTPCWSKTRIQDANLKIGNDSIDESNCGEIAREALLAYKRFFPDTVILYVTNYNKNLVLAQYAKNIECLRCEKNPREKYNCDVCPLDNGYFDSLERNNTSGSGTPNTNINLDSFLPAKDFFEQEFNIVLDEQKLENLKEAVLKEKLGFGKADDKIQGKIIKNIWKSGLERSRCPKCGEMIVRHSGIKGRPDFLCCSTRYDEAKCDFIVSLD